MSKNKKWSTGESRELTSKPMYGVLFVARNKDNKDVEGFKERRRSFVTTKNVEELQEEFKMFVSGSKPGELVRFYYSVNSRSQEKTQKALLHKMLDEQINMASMESVISSVAMKKEQAETKRWMFDFDGTEKQLPVFISEVILAIAETAKRQGKSMFEPLDFKIEKFKTPNGYAVIVDKGFMTEDLMKKWSKTEAGEELVSLKRDDFLCVDWKVAE